MARQNPNGFINYDNIRAMDQLAWVMANSGTKKLKGLLKKLSFPQANAEARAAIAKALYDATRDFETAVQYLCIKRDEDGNAVCADNGNPLADMPELDN